MKQFRMYRPRNKKPRFSKHVRQRVVELFSTGQYKWRVEALSEAFREIHRKRRVPRYINVN